MDAFCASLFSLREELVARLPTLKGSGVPHQTEKVR